MSYDAFISYSHAADGHLAPAVQAGLERLTKAWWSRRALRVFRDETGLGVDPQMWRSIQTALDESTWFVLLASPEAAASRWVNKEIEHWLVSKPSVRILPVLTDGTIEWDHTANDFTADSTAIPPALRSCHTEEPRYLDLRWARTEDELDLLHPRFKAGIATLAAPLHGVTPASLETKDVRTRRRIGRVAITMLAVLAVALGASTLFAVRSAQVEVRASKEAEANAQDALRQQRLATAASRLAAQQQASADATRQQLRATNLKLVTVVNQLEESHSDLAAANDQIAALQEELQRARPDG